MYDQISCGGGSSGGRQTIQRIMEEIVTIHLDPAVELFKKDSNAEDPFWERETRKTRTLRDRIAPDVYTYYMNIDETGRLILNCRVQGCQTPGECQLPQCCSIPLRATGVGIKVDRHPWHNPVFKQGLNPENPREIVAHLTEDAFRVDAMEEACKHGGAQSNKYVRIGVKVLFDIENAPHINKAAETEMYCRVCCGSLQRFVGQKISAMHARLPQLARGVNSYVDEGTRGIVKLPLKVLKWRPRRRRDRGRMRRSDRGRAQTSDRAHS